MKYGYFDDSSREYVITTPKTPLPWINYLGCEDFFSIKSNTSGGYCFYKDAKLLRLTRYRYNNVPFDDGGHYFYIKDGDTVWNPGWQPVQTELDSYECRHGMGYSIFTGVKNGLKAQVTSFVPMGYTCEVNKLTLTNESDTVKNFSVFSYVEFCLWNAMDDMTNFQRNFSTGEVEVMGSVIIHKTEYRERRRHYAIFGVNTPINGFDTDRDSFLGAYRGYHNPQVVEDGKSKNSMASGWAPIGSHQITLSLQPGETKTYIYVLGYCENPADQKWESQGVVNKAPAKALMEAFATEAQADAALDHLKEYWSQLLGKFHVESDYTEMNRMVNVWNQYQCMVTFNMSRSASYFESGIGRGMGFRDSCQDLFGFVHLIPEKARQRIIDIASTQMEDGSAYMEMSYNSEEPDSAEILKVSWKLEDGKILVSLEEGDIYLDTVDGEFVGSLDEDTQVIFGRELVQTGEAQSLDNLDDLEDSEKAKIPKENPYIYHPETDNLEEIIARYLGAANLEKGYEVSLDEDNGTFTAHWAGDEYYDPRDYVGSYRITDDNYINICWREATSEYGDKCYGAVLVDRWNQFTINEDLGNLAEVMTAMANDINSGRVFTAYRTEITEGSENQGAVKFIDEDYEVSYSYQIIPGADPMVTLTRYDSEYDYEQVYTNYQLREML